MKKITIMLEFLDSYFPHAVSKTSSFVELIEHIDI